MQTSFSTNVFAAMARHSCVCFKSLYCLGGFYQDEVAQQYCKKCVPGTYVSPNKLGVSASSCQVVPNGTDTSQFAGYRAGKCLQGHYRLDRFGPCYPCTSPGAECTNEIKTLKPGYWWDMKNETIELYGAFARNLRIENSSYEIAAYAEKALPSIYKCRAEKACSGQEGNPANSICSKGSYGPLCELCHDNYFLTTSGCSRCPAKWRVVLQFVAIVVSVLLLGGYLSWKQTTASQKSDESQNESLDNDKKTGTWLDRLIAAVRIGIGFIQVINGITMALMFVPWPSGMETISRHLAAIEFNLLEVVNPVCISSRLRLDHLWKTVALVSIVSGLILAIAIAYWAWKAHMARKKHFVTFELHRVALQLCFNATIWIIFVSYPALAQYIIATIPYRLYSCISLNCTQMSVSREKSDSPVCQWYLKTDVSLTCDFSGALWKVCNSFLVLVVGIPVVILVLLYMKHRNGCGLQRPQGPLVLALFSSLTFLDGSYKPKFWYWEVLEMFRKLLLTSGLQFFGKDGTMELAIASIIAVVFAILHAHFRPMKKSFKWQNYLQLFSLSIIALNVMLGVLKMIDSRDAAGDVDAGDKVLFSVLFYFVNGLFVLLFIGDH